MPALEAADHGRELIDGTRSVNPVDSRLPAHWTGLKPGQSNEERAAAIRVNYELDKRKRRMAPAEALKRIAALRKLP